MNPFVHIAQGIRKWCGAFLPTEGKTQIIFMEYHPAASGTPNRFPTARDFGFYVFSRLMFPVRNGGWVKTKKTNAREKPLSDQVHGGLVDMHVLNAGARRGCEDLPPASATCSGLCPSLKAMAGVRRSLGEGGLQWIRFGWLPLHFFLFYWWASTLNWVHGRL